MRRIVRVAGGAVAAAVALPGCSIGPSLLQEEGESPSPPSHVLTVFAAASLSDVMERIADQFEIEHPGVAVALTYGGSSDLAAQIVEGAPADVFASANEAQMDVVAEEAAGAPVVFATNTLASIVPAGNPAGVSGIEDLADPDVVSVICAPQVPCGAATATLAERAGVVLAPASEEQSVTDVLGKVASGQADAGVVYVTDAAREVGIETVPVPGADAVITRYPAAAMAGAADPVLAAEFVAYLAGPEAAAVLADAGFGAP